MRDSERNGPEQHDLSRIAHDLNGLLAVILNYAELLAEQLPEGQMRHDISEIQEAATSAARLTGELLRRGREPKA